VQKTETPKNVIKGEVIVDGSASVDEDGTVTVNPYQGLDTGYAQGDRYVCSDSVEYTESIDGNLFIFGENIVVKDGVVILGNAFVAGNNIEINANIAGSLFVAGENISFNGEAGYIYAAGQNFTIAENAYVEKDVKFAGESFVNKGMISRDLLTASESTTIGDGLFAKVNGKVQYTGELIADDSAVSKVEKIEDKIGASIPTEEIAALSAAFSQTMKTIVNTAEIITGILFVIILAIVFKNRKEDNENYGKNILIGFGYMIGIPFLMVVLMITVIGIPVGLLVLLLYIVAMALALPAAAVAFAQKVFDKDNSIFKVIVIASLLVVLFKGIALVPTVGGIVTFIIRIYGFYRLSSLFTTVKKEDTPVVTGTVAE
jgi:hypothetical protein